MHTVMIEDVYNQLYWSVQMKESKVCTVCKVDLPLTSYHNSSATKDGKGYRCISCDVKARKNYKLNNQERIQTLNRVKLLRSRFKISEDELMSMMDSQKGCCAICEKSLVDPSSKSTKQYGIDHNHKTGEVRGLLCMHCNSMLGQAMDSPSILLAGYNYLITNGYYGD